jgi:DnaJ-domain-containing protein 1
MIESPQNILRRTLNRVQDGVVRIEQQGGVVGLAERWMEVLRRQEERISSGKTRLNPEFYRQLKQWYALLELPMGSDAAAVRTAYRRLMRIHHPDLHAQSAESSLRATRISQDLTVAYEGLLDYLQASPFSAGAR